MAYNKPVLFQKIKNNLFSKKTRMLCNDNLFLEEKKNL